MKKILISAIALMLTLMMMVPVWAEENAADTSLADAQTAYNEAKQDSAVTDYETELQEMVNAGSLEQEEADILLAAAKESAALRNGECPECGYQFQNCSLSKNGRSFGKGCGMNGCAVNSGTVSEDATDLEKAQAAYNTAKQNSRMDDYESELKSMVEAGSLTQEQADLLLSAAKESEALASGTCPNCGYRFRTVSTTFGRNGTGNGRGMNAGNGRGGKR